MLEFDPVQFFMIAATFLVAFGLLSKIAYKPLKTMLEGRERQIKENLDKAEQERKAMEQLKAEYDLKVSEVEKKMQEMIKDATKVAQATKDDIIKEAHEEANDIIAKTQQRLIYEREKGVKGIKNRSNQSLPKYSGKSPEAINRQKCSGETSG